MLDYTIDVLLIGVIAVLIIEAIKAPIKAAFEKKGLTEDDKMKKIFKVIALTVSITICFAGSCIYFQYFKHVNPFESIDILWYFLGTLGASQTIYIAIETYGRDGVLEWIKAAITNRKKTTDLTAVQKLSNDQLAQVITNGISEIYEDAPVTVDEVKQILDHIT